MAALDAWFGRHLDHLTPASLEIVEQRANAPAHDEIAPIKRRFCLALARERLGWRPRSAEETLTATAESLLALWESQES